MNIIIKSSQWSVSKLYLSLSFSSKITTDPCRAKSLKIIMLDMINYEHSWIKLSKKFTIEKTHDIFSRKKSIYQNTQIKKVWYNKFQFSETYFSLNFAILYLKINLYYNMLKINCCQHKILKLWIIERMRVYFVSRGCPSIHAMALATQKWKRTCREYELMKTIGYDKKWI